MRGENALLLSVRVENAFAIHHCKSTEVCHTSHHAPPWLTSRPAAAPSCVVCRPLHSRRPRITRTIFHTHFLPLLMMKPYPHHRPCISLLQGNSG